MNIPIRWTTAWIAIAAVVAPVAAHAQSVSDQAAADVVQQMQSFDVLAQRAGRLAVRHGSAGDIRHYGDRLVRDAHRLDVLTQRYAHSHGIARPSASARSSGAGGDAHADEVVQQLEQLSGVAFDQVMLTETASSAQHAIMQLSQDRGRTADAELQTLIDTATRILQQDHEVAIQLERAR